MGEFLRIFFGCHQRPDRSFFFRGRQFLLCARCTGELIGILTGIPIVIFIGYPQFYVVALLMIPMAADGFLQLLTPYESKNIRRLTTGILFGVAFVFFLVYFHRTCIAIACGIVKLVIKDGDMVDRIFEKFMI